MRRISRLWILTLALFPAVGSAQLPALETRAGFVSASRVRNCGAAGLDFVISNGTAVAGGVIDLSGAANSRCVAIASGSTRNTIAMRMTNAPAVTIAGFFKIRAVNNSSKYGTPIFNLLVGSGNDGAAIYITSNSVMGRARSAFADSATEAISSAFTFSNRWRHIAAVCDYTNNFVAVYLDGALVASNSATFANRRFAPQTGTTADGLLNSDASGISANAQGGGFLAVPRAMSAAEVLADFRRRGKDFLNP